jgi:hypothetical protein
MMLLAARQHLQVVVAEASLIRGEEVLLANQRYKLARRYSREGHRVHKTILLLWEQ